MSRTIFLTGGTGFIGTHVRQALSLHGYDLAFSVRDPGPHEGPGRPHVLDLSNPQEMSGFLSKLKPEFVLHLAAAVKPGLHSSSLEEQTQHTVTPARTIASALPIETRLSLFVGSSDEYGPHSSPTLLEETDEGHPVSPYGVAKKTARAEVLEVAKTRGRSVTWLRPFLVYGPGQKGNGLVPSLIRAAKNNESLDLTPGEQLRDFLWVDDLTTMLLKILENPERAASKTFNLCTGKGRSVRQFGERLQHLSGATRLNWGAIPYRPQESMHLVGSNQKFESHFGPMEHTPLDETLRRLLR